MDPLLDPLLDYLLDSLLDPFSECPCRSYQLWRGFYPRVWYPKLPKITSLFGYPTRKYPWNSETNPTQPIPVDFFGSGRVIPMGTRLKFLPLGTMGTRLKFLPSSTQVLMKRTLTNQTLKLTKILVKKLYWFNKLFFQFNKWPFNNFTLCKYFTF